MSDIILENLDNIINSKWGENNLSGKVVEIEGVKIAGLGGTFNRKIWYPPEDTIFESMDDWDSANKNQKYC